MTVMEWNEHVNTDFGFEGEYGYEPESVDVLRFESGKERRAPKNSWVPMEYPMLSLMLDDTEIAAHDRTELELFRWWYEVTLRQGTLPFRIPRLGRKGETAIYKFVPDSMRYDEFRSPVMVTFGLVETGRDGGAMPTLPDPLPPTMAPSIVEWVLEQIAKVKDSILAYVRKLVDDITAEDQSPLPGTDVTIGPDGRTVNAANQRPLAGSGISVNDRTVSIPANGITDAMLGNRNVQNPATQAGTQPQNLTQIADNAANAIRALRTQFEGFQELAETDIREIISRKELIELIIAELQGTSAEALAELHQLIDGLTARDHRPIAGAGTAVNNRTVSIPANGITDAMIGNREITDPNVNTATFAGNLTAVFNRFSAFLRTVFTGNPVRLAVGHGGTGAVDTAGARTSLGVPPVSHAVAATTHGVAANGVYGHIRTGRTTDTGVDDAFITTRVAVPGGGTVNLDEYTEQGYFIFTGGSTADAQNVLGGPPPSVNWLRGTTHSQFAMRVWHTTQPRTLGGTRQTVWRCGTSTGAEQDTASDVWHRFAGNSSNWGRWERVPMTIRNGIAATGGDNVAASVSAVRAAIAAIDQRPVAGDNVTVNDRTVNAENMRPLAGTGITVNDRTVSLAPHDVNANTFGEGTAANWGHLRTSDIVSNSANTRAAELFEHIDSAGNVNLNDERWRREGIYLLRGANSNETITNGPWATLNTTTNLMRLEVKRLNLRTATDSIRQTAYRGNGEVWTRRITGGSWDAWARVPMSIANEVAASGGDWIAASVSAVRAARDSRLALAGGTMTGRLVLRGAGGSLWRVSLTDGAAMFRPLGSHSNQVRSVLGWLDGHGNAWGIGRDVGATAPTGTNLLDFQPASVLAGTANTTPLTVIGLNTSGQISAMRIANNVIPGAAIADGSVTRAKLAAMGDSIQFNGEAMLRRTGTWANNLMWFIEGDSNGGALLMQSGGMMIIGSGEAAAAINNNRAEFGGFSPGTEEMILASDQGLRIVTNLQTFANRNAYDFRGGNVEIPGEFRGNLPASRLTGTVNNSRLGGRVGSLGGLPAANRGLVEANGDATVTTRAISASIPDSGGDASIPTQAAVRSRVAAEAQARAQGDADTLGRAEQLVLEAQLATNTWLPPANTVALLPPASGLDANKNYLCKVLNDPVQADNIVWQLAGGSIAWARFGAMPILPPASAAERGGVRVQTGNGLAFGTGANADRLQMNAAVPGGAAGSMTGADKARLDALHEGAFTSTAAILQIIHPIGSYYTQYPVVGATTHAAMFPAARTPAQLFGGTWTERFHGEEVFFRTTGAANTPSGGQLGANRGRRWDGATLSWVTANPSPVNAANPGVIAGVEHDAIRNITGHLKASARVHIGTDPFSGGAFSRADGRGWGLAGGDGWAEDWRQNFNASHVVPVDTANRPRNRLVRIWERTG